MPDQLSRIMSLRDVASQINSDGDLDTLLRDLIQAACRHGSWDLGSIMTVDLAHGYALVTARHETNAMLRSRVVRAKCNVAEETETHAARAQRVVTGRTNGAETSRRATVQREIDAVEHCACAGCRSKPRPSAHHGISIEAPAPRCCQ